MRFVVFDIEVYSHDWIVVFQDAETDRQHLVYNNFYEIREIIKTHRDAVFTGFNNKFYDDWILLSMLLGADNAMIKKHSDFIIGGRHGWEFPFVQYQKRDFYSMDLRDDLDEGLSLKAIDANTSARTAER